MEKIYESGEDYLEAIYVIQKIHGSVRSVELAEFMGYSKPSISCAVANLQKKKFLIKDEKSFLHLTESGLKIAKNIYERHRFFTQLFISFGVEPRLAEDDACKVEHVISEETFKKIKENVKFNINDDLDKGKEKV